LGIVRYESDLFAWPHRLRQLLRRAPQALLHLDEILIDHWLGPEPGERLSVDWDCFASILQDRKGVDGRVAAFLDRLGGAAPQDIYVSYSPEYVHRTLERFLEFVRQLERHTGQPVAWLSPGLPRGELHPTNVCAGLPKWPLKRLILYLRRKGIY
jgi:hypothetical protein